MKHYFLLIALFFAHGFLSAQLVNWQPLERPWGVVPIKTCVTRIGHIFVLEYGALSRSTDGGNTQAFVKGLPATRSLPPNTPVEYLIRFQNTGTDTAFTVVVSDRLSPRLDLQSVRPGVSSHPYRLEIRDDRTLRFIFENIALPDSNINEPASHGFVKFSVNPVANLPLGTAINNVADIYFDFNAPVRTNTVELKVQLPVSVHAPASRPLCLVSPNPADAFFMVQLEDNGRAWAGDKRLELFDVAGQLVLRQSVSGAQAQVSRNGLPAGMYWLKVTAANGTRAQAKVVLK